MQEFINPKSMLTPGVAGSLMMFLLNGIAFQFPEIPYRYLALFLSFLIGAIIVWFSETRGKSLVLQKAVYWILNSLVIFVVGFGITNLAADATVGTSKAIPLVIEKAEEKAVPMQSKSKNQFFKRLEASKAGIPLVIEKAEKKAVPMQPESKNQFFKRW